MIQERLPGTNPTMTTRYDSYIKACVKRPTRYKQILQCFIERPQMTAKECAVEMHRRGFIPNDDRNHAAPRLNEMSKIGIVEPIGKKKCPYTGKTVAVYALVEH